MSTENWDWHHVDTRRRVRMDHVRSSMESEMAAPDPTSGPRTTTSLDLKRAPDAFRVLDWTKVDATPSLSDVKRLISMAAPSGTVRLAIIVNTPKKLRAATVFAEQVSAEGGQVRVFV